MEAPIIPTCRRLVLAALLVGQAVPAAAIGDAGDLAAYVRARAADGDGRGDLAASDYARALEAAPDNAVVAIRSYRAGLKAGDAALVARARAALEKAKVEPGDTALLALADAVRGGNAAETEAALDRIGRGPLDFIAAPLRAWTLAESDPKRAMALVDAIPRRSLTGRYVAEARALLAMAAGQQGAAMMVDALLASAPDDLDLRLNAARLLARSGDRGRANALLPNDDPAFDAARKQLEGRPISTAAFGISRFYTRIAGDLTDPDTAPLAIVLARGALALDPGYDSPRIALAKALGNEGAVAAALATLDEIPPDSPWFTAQRIERIALLQRSGRERDALAIAADLARAPGADVAAIQREGDLLMANARFADAAIAYRRAIDRAGERADWVLYLQAGSALDRAGRWRDARPLIEKSVALAPDQPVALNYLGYGALENGGDVEAARKLLEHAAALKPGDESILDSLGWSYLLGGDVARALPMLEKAASGAPDNATISEHLGDAYWLAGRRFEARYAWSAAALLAAEQDRARIADKIATGLTGR